MDALIILSYTEETSKRKQDSFYRHFEREEGKAEQRKTTSQVAVHDMKSNSFGRLHNTIVSRHMILSMGRRREIR